MENPFLKYKRKGEVLMRRYIPGEDLTGITVSKEDSPAAGGMIVRNPDNENDQWYISEQYFKDHYAESNRQAYVPDGRK